MSEDLERLMLAEDPEIKIEREEGGRFSLSGGSGLFMPELPEAVEMARERIEECREAIKQADERVAQGMDTNHSDQDGLLEKRHELASELTFLSEFVSWAEKVVDD